MRKINRNKKRGERGQDILYNIHGRECGSFRKLGKEGIRKWVRREKMAIGPYLSAVATTSFIPRETASR